MWRMGKGDLWVWERCGLEEMMWDSVNGGGMW